MPSIAVDILTPDRRVLQAQADSVVVPAWDGSSEILAHHAPLLAQLQAGEIRMRTGNDLQLFAVSGGFVEVQNNHVTVMAETAEMAHEIDIERARQAAERAKAALRSPQAEINLAEAEAALRRALARLHAAELRAVTLRLPAFANMPEEPLETGELQEKLDEALERAEEAGEERASPKWTLFLSLSTALIAVIAAIASLQAGSFVNQALLVKNEAVLAQAKASDQWAYYQAKGIKSIIYQVSGKNAAEAKRYKDEQTEIKKEADEIEKSVTEKNEEAEHLLHHHHQFALSVTFFQVSIALAAIASLTRRKGMWYVGLALAASGLMFFIHGWL